MSYKMIIVDDEPPFIRMVEKKLSEVTDQLEMVASANNGVEALDKISELKPDVVISDIKMPVMDGLELARLVKAQYPEIVFVLMSGYRDFEYAKKALVIGVKDYLLKPIELKALQEVSKEIIGDLSSLNRRKIENSFSRLLHGKELIDSEPSRALERKTYYVLAVNIGYLSHIQADDDDENDLDLLIQHYFEDMMRHVNYYSFIFNRDNREAVLIIESSQIEVSHLRSIIDGLAAALKAAFRSYTTIVFDLKPKTYDRFYNANKKNQDVMTRELIIGTDRKIDSGEEKYSGEDQFILEPSIESKIIPIFQTRNMNALRNELSELFEQWERNALPAYLVERNLKHILVRMEKEIGQPSESRFMEVNRELDDLLASVHSFGQLSNGYWDIINSSYSENYKRSFRDDEELVAAIENYIGKNLTKDLRLQHICDFFGSQVSISRAFRSRRNCTYNECVIRRRIDLAKELMESDKALLIKDISVLVGYPDHHYFSRIFKKMTGEKPSEYQSRMQG